MACPNFVNLCHVAGTNVYVDFQYVDDEGLPIDLTGVTAQFQYLTSASDLTSVIDLTGGVTDGINGLGRFTLTPAQSQTLIPIGDTDTTKIFKSHLMFTYPDTTIEVVAGVDSTYNQNLIR